MGVGRVGRGRSCGGMGKELWWGWGGFGVGMGWGILVISTIYF